MSTPGKVLHCVLPDAIRTGHLLNFCPCVCLSVSRSQYGLSKPPPWWSWLQMI